MTYEQLSKLAEESGFTSWAPLDVSTIVLRPEVRDMCAVNTCQQYDKRWSCPPGCGTLEENTARLKSYTRGIIVQTCGDVEDSFDFEGIMEIAASHGENYSRMHDVLLKEKLDILALGTDGCQLCKTCTYPDAPCRFPDKMVASMEAFGMLVLEVCQANGLQYYYGPEKLAFTGCFLLKD